MEHDNLKQQLHEYKKKIDTLEILQKEYQEEIERLLDDKRKIKTLLETERSKMQEERNNLRKEDNERADVLTQQISKLETENVNLREEIEVFKKRLPTLNDVPEKIAKTEVAVDENQKTIIEDLNSKLKSTIDECREIKNSCNDIIQERDNLQEMFNLKREEIVEKNEIIQSLKDENILLKSELDSVRTKPLDEQSRGNSLFAEVNDSRVQLLQKLGDMKNKFDQMQKKISDLQEHNEILLNEKFELTKIFESDFEKYKLGNPTEIDSYKSAMISLTNLIRAHEKTIQNLRKNIATECRDDQFYKLHIEKLNDEIQSLKSANESLTLNRIILKRKQSELGVEMVQWKIKSIDLENQIKLLELKNMKV